MVKVFLRFYSKVFLSFIIALFFFPSQSFAYLDPGTGSIILQGIIGGLATIAVVGKLYWHRLLRLFGIRKDISYDACESNPHENTHIKRSESQKLNK